MTAAATERVPLTKITLTCRDGNDQFIGVEVDDWADADDILVRIWNSNTGTAFFETNQRADVLADIRWADGTNLRLRAGVTREDTPDCLALTAAQQFKYLRSSGFHNKTTTNVDLDGFHDRA